MAEFYADWSRMLSLSEELETSSKNIKNLVAQTGTIKNNLIIGNEVHQIQGALDKSNQKFERIINLLRKSSDVMEQAANTYKSTELGLLGRVVEFEGKNSSQKTTNTSQENQGTEGESSNGWLDFLFGAIGKCGVVGKGAETVYKILKGLINGGDYGIDDWIKYGAGIVGSASSFISSFLKKGAIDLFGLAKNTAKSAMLTPKASWAEYFGNDFKNDLDDYVGSAGKGAAVCKWVGLAATFVSKFVDNYNEYGNQITPAGIEETFFETATDTLLKTGAHAAVAATIGALGLSPPGLVVGIASFIIVEGGNALVKHFTGQTATEWISDTAIKVVNSGAQYLKDSARDLREFGRKVGEVTADFFGDAARSASNFFHSIFAR